MRDVTVSKPSQIFNLNSFVNDEMIFKMFLDFNKCGFKVLKVRSRNRTFTRKLIFRLLPFFPPKELKEALRERKCGHDADDAAAAAAFEINSNVQDLFGELYAPPPFPGFGGGGWGRATRCYVLLGLIRTTGE